MNLRTIHRATSLASLLAVLALAGAVPAAADCPASLVSMLGIPASSTSAAVFDTVGDVGEASWDMGSGRVFMRSNGWLTGIVVDAFDDFDVTGVAAGTPVDLVAVLTVDGAVWTDGCGGSGCGGLYEVKLFHGDDSLVVLHADQLFTGRIDHHDVLQLPLTITAGQPERLEIRAHGRRSPGGAHLSEATSVLTFTGLPAGVGITSCKGFAGAVVPARPSTWGRVKSLYR